MSGKEFGDRASWHDESPLEGREHLVAPPGWGIVDPARDPAGQDETIRRLIAAITQNGRFQVIERLEQRTGYHQPDGTATKHAVYVDVETTGLGDGARIIQLAIAPFDFAADGRIFDVATCESWLEDPGIPIPDEVSALTGLTDADVAGKRIDDARVAELLEGAVLVIAHSARFDRPKLEARLPVFATKPWACSCDEVPWIEEGLQAKKLEWLAYRLCGMFFDAHRADGDVAMGVHLLTQRLPRSGRLAMELLLESARTKTARVWAVQTPPSTKDALKGRGYRWNPGDDGRPKAWYRDIPLAHLMEETTWLATSGVYPGGPKHQVQVLDARTRFSPRADRVPPRAHQEVLAVG